MPAPRKARATATKPQGRGASSKDVRAKASQRKAPEIPGATKKAPIVGMLTPRPKTPRKDHKKTTDPVEKSDDYTKSKTGYGPKMSHLAKMYRLKALIEPITPGLIQVCVDIAYDKKVHAAVRLDAATRLLDRAYGKPKEHVVIEDPAAEGGVDEVRKLLNNILESVGAPLLDPPSAVNDLPGSEEGRNAQGEE